MTLKKGVQLLLLLVLALPGEASGSQQCVTYARNSSGLILKGDAWMWWGAADGLYSRGNVARDGAVLVFDRQGSMTKGHVAVVSKVEKDRKVVVGHANWAPLHSAGRGKVSEGICVLDVSPGNDWSRVRVWYHNSGGYGRRVYKTLGFIYPDGKRNNLRNKPLPSVVQKVDLPAQQCVVNTLKNNFQGVGKVEQVARNVITIRDIQII